MIEKAHATHIKVGCGELVVDLSDGRTLAIPLSWYPRLAEASESELTCWELIGHGKGIRWPEIDEDISVEALLKGYASTESLDSLNRWRCGRTMSS